MYKILLSKFEETTGILSKNQVDMIHQSLKQIFETSSDKDEEAFHQY